MDGPCVRPRGGRRGGVVPSNSLRHGFDIQRLFLALIRMMCKRFMIWALRFLNPESCESRGHRSNPSRHEAVGMQYCFGLNQSCSRHSTFSINLVRGIPLSQVLLPCTGRPARAVPPRQRAPASPVITPCVAGSQSLAALSRLAAGGLCCQQHAAGHCCTPVGRGLL